MPQINFKSFTEIMRNRYKEVSDDVKDIPIELEDDLYLKKNTLDILKEFNINPLKVKKIVSLNQDGKLVVDNGLLINDIFISNESLSQEDQNLFNKSQLLFIEDENDNTKINVYKVLFNETVYEQVTSEGEKIVNVELIPEMVKLRDMTSKLFSDLFINTNLFNEEFLLEKENNNNLKTYFDAEKIMIDVASVNYLTRLVQQPVLINFPFQNNTNDEVRTKLQNESLEGLYSLEIKNNKIEIWDIKSDQEKLIFEQNLSQDWQVKWDAIGNNRYQKMYFSKNPDSNLVKQWVVDDVHNELQCIETTNLSDLRKKLVNNNLFFSNLNGIFCGENGTQAEVARVRVVAEEKETELEPLVTKLPPAIVNNVINLKWDNTRELWDLNITTSNLTLDKKLKLEKDENDILKNLIDKNNNANTVILFNKCDGSFLRAYYFNENNKKVNCSNKLSDEDKEKLSAINQKAKARVMQVRRVKPIFYWKSSLFSKNTKTFNLNIINGKCYVLCNDEFNIPLKAEVLLTLEQISALSYLVKDAVDFSLTFDEDNSFKSVSYRDHVEHSDVTIDVKDLPISNTFNKKNIKTDELMKVIMDSFINSQILKPEDDWVTPKLWNSDTADKVNGTSSSIEIQQCLQQQKI